MKHSWIAAGLADSVQEPQRMLQSLAIRTARWKLRLEAMSWLKYAPAAGIIIFILILIGVIKHKERINERLAADMHRLETELIISRQELSSAQGAIKRQNGAISQHALDMEEAEKQHALALADLRDKSSQARAETGKELVRDPSCENELRLIKEQLQAFYE